MVRHSAIPSYTRADSFVRRKNIYSIKMYRCADKSLAQQGRKQANDSVRMASISFGALPCRKKNLMTARISMLLKSRAALTCFRTCFLPRRAKDLPAHRQSLLLFSITPMTITPAFSLKPKVPVDNSDILCFSGIHKTASNTPLCYPSNLLTHCSEHEKFWTMHHNRACTNLQITKGI